MGQERNRRQQDIQTEYRMTEMSFFSVCVTSANGGPNVPGTNTTATTAKTTVPVTNTTATTAKTTATTAKTTATTAKTTATTAKTTVPGTNTTVPGTNTTATINPSASVTGPTNPTTTEKGTSAAASFENPKYVQIPLTSLLALLTSAILVFN
ncbi:autotransporter adhesin BpaC-like [Octopus sinensis]|uniref:Autotransporter adhesin BpaC-like n=1 Tax=Octopus sinensis TaxID=2607531 RepID=A0A7E6EXH5_9MOLL|nr:autotransporter adhesin BpaC-like [Octopus sinensis]